MTQQDWSRISRLLDYVLAQSGGAKGIEGPTEKPKKVRKAKAPKPEPPMQQLRLL